MKNRHLLWVICAGASILASGALWFLFELRYTWFVDVDDFKFLRYGFLTGIGLIVLLWTLFPSRLLVALAGIGILAFPPVLGGGKFVPVDAAYSVWMLGGILLLLVATELNRWARLPR